MHILAIPIPLNAFPLEIVHIKHLRSRQLTTPNDKFTSDYGQTSAKKGRMFMSKLWMLATQIVSFLPCLSILAIESACVHSRLLIQLSTHLATYEKSY